MGSWVCAPIVIWVFVGGEFLLVMGVRFVGLAVLDGVTVGLAVGCGYHRRFGSGRHRWCGHGPWAMGRGYGAGFFLLGFLGSNGGSMSGYNGGSVVGCACVVGCCLICGAGLVVLWVAV